jgi:protein gp37
MFSNDKMYGVPGRSSIVARTHDFNKPLKKDRKGNYKNPPGYSLTLNMTSDTFIEEADEWRDEMWDIIRKRPDIIFIILTKRVHRIMECLPDDWNDGYENVDLSITVENQQTFDERWPIYKEVPAKHKGLHLTPLLGPIDLSPALDSGQIEEVFLGGECFSGRRPCHHEWIEDISRKCEEHRVNLFVDSVGATYVKDGEVIKLRSSASQCAAAFDTGLSRFYGLPKHILRDPKDGHILSEDELFVPMYNIHKCARCTRAPLCGGCDSCGYCKLPVDLVTLDELLKLPKNSEPHP